MLKIMQFFLYAVCFLFALGYDQVSATDRDLSGVDLITRAERGADESLRLQDHPWYDRWELNIAEYELWQEGSYPDSNGAFEAQQNRREKYEVSNERILKHNINDIDFQDFSLDKRGPYADGIVQTTGGKTLRRPQVYRDKKTKIIVHHTASDDQIDTDEEVSTFLKELQVQHTFSNGWGDIGYNFLIDQSGNIYEGRAGGEGVIGAHASWNNAPSIGVALIGDFHENVPPQKMLESLTYLITSLSWKYDIYPYTRQSYYFPKDLTPYIEVHEHESIVGHTHVGNTLCPGQYVLEYLPTLKKNVQVLLQYSKNQGKLEFEGVDFIFDVLPVRSNDNEAVVKIPFDTSGEVSCQILDDKIEVLSCFAQGRVVYLKLQRKSYGASGAISFQLIDKLSGRVGLGTATLVREKDLEQLQQLRKLTYNDAYGLLPVSARTEKVSDDIYLEDVSRLLDVPVNVLLYELTTGFREWDISCSNGCEMVLNNQIRLQDVTSAQVVAIGDNLTVTIGKDAYQIQTLEILNEGIVTFENYGRASYAGIPWNRFRGNITIKKDLYRHLQKGWLTDRMVINTLDVFDYRAGIAETNDQDHIEKVKAIMLAVKNYTLHYIEGKNLHPYVPADGIYTMIDDPRMMQKYVGYGYEETVKSWFEALRELKDVWVTYREKIVILPYYHCSAGFTRSGKEKFGRVDTPWLQSKLDLASCESGTFSGHGVGMSGSGAARLAEAGVKAEEIVKRYYNGVQVKAQ